MQFHLGTRHIRFFREEEHLKLERRPLWTKLGGSFDGSIFWFHPWELPLTWPTRLEWDSLDWLLVWDQSSTCEVQNSCLSKPAFSTFPLSGYYQLNWKFAVFYLSRRESCRWAGFLASGSARSSRTPASCNLFRSSLTCWIPLLVCYWEMRLNQHEIYLEHVVIWPEVYIAPRRRINH